MRRFFKSSLAWGLIGIVCVYALLSFVIVYHFGISDKAAQFGELFGGINGLFTALAFGGALYALRIQQKEFERQGSVLQQGQRELAQQTRLLTEQLVDALRPNHPVERAEMQLDLADQLLSRADELFQRSAATSPEEEARATLAQTSQSESAAWKTYLDARVALELAIYNPRPGSRRSLYLMIAFQAKLKELRAHDLAQLRETLEECLRLQQ